MSNRNCFKDICTFLLKKVDLISQSYRAVMIQLIKYRYVSQFFLSNTIKDMICELNGKVLHNSSYCHSVAQMLSDYLFQERKGQFKLYD